MIDRQVSAQAYMMSANDFFALTTVLLLILAAVVWLAKPQQRPSLAAAADSGH